MIDFAMLLLVNMLLWFLFISLCSFVDVGCYSIGLMMLQFRCF